MRDLPSNRSSNQSQDTGRSRLPKAHGFRFVSGCQEPDNRSFVQICRLFVLRHLRQAVVDWEVPNTAWRPLVEGLGLPDPKDRHVLAAAIAGHADRIVTANLKDFPQEVLDQHGIEAIHPDAFLINQWDLDELVVLGAFKRMRARWINPPVDAEGFAQSMERGGMPLIAQRLREAAELI